MKNLCKTISLLVVLGLAGPAFAEPAKWSKLCGNCHGKDGTGKTKMGEKLKIGDMTDAAWHKGKSDADMKSAVRNGNAKVKKPAISADKLTDGELDEMIGFVKSLKK